MDKIYRLVDLEQDTDAWREFRKKKAGSSSAAAIMKESRWDTPLSLFEKMVYDKQVPMNSAMERGKLEEPKARAWLSEHLAIPFRPVVVELIEQPRIIASLDGFIDLGENSTGCEIKAPGLEDHLSAMEGIIPSDYQWQMQHEMMVTGCREWWYLSWDGAKGIPILLKRDEAKIEILKKEEIAFLDRIDTFEPPEPIDKDWMVLEDEDAELLAIQYNDLCKGIKSREEWRDKLKAQLLELANEFHPRTKIRDLLKIQKITRKGNVDYSKVPELRGVNLDKYRKEPIESWRIN